MYLIFRILSTFSFTLLIMLLCLIGKTEDCIEGNCINGKGKKVWQNGRVYIGEFKNGLRDGIGMHEINGNKYEGEWKEDNINGQGKYTFADGKSYEGEFKNNKFHGQGKFTLADGTIIEGEYKEGNFIKEKTKEVKEAQCLNAKTDIQVIAYGELGNITRNIEYRGEGNTANNSQYGDRWNFKDCQYQGDLFKNRGSGLEERRGYGTSICSDGLKYQGQWNNNRIWGQGTLIMPDTSIYKGEFESGRFNGQGDLILCNGERYSGEWKEGKINGKGILIYKYDSKLKVGAKYDGQFKRGFKHGKGKLTLPDGKIENGIWKNGKLAEKSAPKNKEQQKLDLNFAEIKKELKSIYVTYLQISTMCVDTGVFNDNEIKQLKSEVSNTLSSVLKGGKVEKDNWDYLKDDTYNEALNDEDYLAMKAIFGLVGNLSYSQKLEARPQCDDSLSQAQFLWNSYKMKYQDNKKRKRDL